MVLYCRGSLAAFSESLCIAVVGTRTPSEYSKRVAAYAGRELAQRGICVLSGCSEGIDAEVHRAALSVGRTAAVLSCPLDKNYPASNEGLRREILRHGGALVSEFPPGTEFFPEQFALRNRLLSALSDGVVVVEASAKSGSLSTARAAADQGREVFCVPPADLFNPRYDGVKPLLREGAAQFLSVGDVTEAFRYQFSVAATLPEEGTAHSPDLLSLIHIYLPVGLSKTQVGDSPYTPKSLEFLVTLDELKTLKSFAKGAVVRMCEQLFAGEIGAVPLEGYGGGHSACDYCAYASVCGHTPGQPARRVEHWDKQTLLEQIKEDDHA